MPASDAKISGDFDLMAIGGLSGLGFLGWLGTDRIFLTGIQQMTCVCRCTC